MHVFKILQQDANQNSRGSTTQEEPDKGSPTHEEPQGTSENKGLLHKGSFRTIVTSFRKSKRYSKRQSQSEEDSSPEKKEPSNESYFASKIRNSFKAIKKIDFSTAQDRAENELPAQNTEEESRRKKELLSVMEINTLINDKHIKEAFEHIKLVEEKLLEDYSTINNYTENITEYTLRAKDVHLLYENLFRVIKSVVKDSLDCTNTDEQMVYSVVHIINEDALNNYKVAGDNSEIPYLGQHLNWKRLWKQVIRESVTERVDRVPFPTTTTSDKPWLADYLDSLKANTVQDLLKVKNTLSPLYPEDYDVCGTYIQCFHGALSSTLQNKILPLCQQLSQLYSFLNWVLNTYTSDTFMGSPDLQLEVTKANLSPLLDSGCLNKLKQDYIIALQETIKAYLTKILEIEMEKWELGEEPEKETLQDSSLSPIYIDIVEMTGKHVRESTKLSEDLEISSSLACMEEIGNFAARLQTAFKDWSSSRFTAVCLQYLVLYTNSFIKLRNNIPQSDSEQDIKGEENLTKAIHSLKQHFFQLFKMETEPHFQKLITKKWLKKGTAFQAIRKTADLYKVLKYLIEPNAKEMGCEVHRYLVKAYITQIMMRKMRLNRLKRKKASETMRRECEDLNNIAQELGSDQEWLSPSIQYISEIIGLRKTDEIQSKIETFFKAYPDIGEEHILSILHLQGMGRNKKLSMLYNFRELQNTEAPTPPNGPQQRLFAEIECSTRVSCFSSF
ncbi:exocyst complex component 3-like protein 4 [Rhinophrynus dorsalis]